MMRSIRVRGIGLTVCAALLVSGCGGGSGGSGGGGGTSATPTPTPAPGVAGCSLREREDWALAQLSEWYLFPTALASGANPAAYSTLPDYVDALTATARAQGHDRYFTYVTSIASEDAYYSAGSNAGYGFRIAVDTTGLTVLESFEGAPALAAGIDRGARITAIGNSPSTMRDVSDIMAAQGSAGVDAALASGSANTTRVLRVTDASGTRDVSVTQADYTLLPVSSRYGAKTIDDGGRKVGYINLRTFISPANSALTTAFAQFQAAGVTDVIVDLRYNGGGLVSVAETLASLMGRNRATSDVIDYLSYRPEKASQNYTGFFAPQTQSLAPTRIAFIGLSGTASASELVINAFIPYLHANAGLIGGNTFGKPVGQIAVDRPQCDDRLRIIAFAVQNSAHQGDYYSGLASKVEASCRAADDTSKPLGDPNEASTRAALDFIAGRSCTAIAGSQSPQAAGAQHLLIPEHPTTAQREMPGSF